MSNVTPEEREAKQRNAAIEQQLRKDAREYENTIKILLLGAFSCEQALSDLFRVRAL